MTLSLGPPPSLSVKAKVADTYFDLKTVADIHEKEWFEVHAKISVIMTL